MVIEIKAVSSLTGLLICCLLGILNIHFQVALARRVMKVISDKLESTFKNKAATYSKVLNLLYKD
jgi:hypothetical protein